MENEEIRELINAYFLANEEKDTFKRNIIFTRLVPYLDKKELKELLQQSFNTEEIQ